jgi:hypothetical protein
MKNLRITPDVSTGTSFHGETIRCSVKTLKEKLGQPVIEENDGFGKVNYRWHLMTDKGYGFTLYDYKHYRPLDEDELVDWHIGAKNANESKICKEALIHFIAYGTDEHPGA